MKKFTKIITAAFVALLGLTAFTTPVFADDPPATTNICDLADVAPEVKAAAGCKTTGTSSTPEFKTVVVRILNSVLGILALVAVVVIIIGGVNYMTSTGDPSKTKKAKDTILYGVIGLIIAALAFAIVNFVVNTIKTAGQPASNTQTTSQTTGN